MPHLTFNGKRLQANGLTFTMRDPFIDWYLPSQNELISIRINLANEGVGDLSFGTYWSSTENTYNSAVQQSSGSGSPQPKGNVYKVRASRTFSASIDAYSLRDRGPAGGWIYFIDGTGTVYYEAAPYDLTSSVWSNITNVLIGGTGSTTGTGQANTTLIINQSGHTNSAAKLCDDLIIQ